MIDFDVSFAFRPLNNADASAILSNCFVFTAAEDVVNMVNWFAWLHPTLKRRPWKKATSVAMLLFFNFVKMDSAIGIIVFGTLSGATFGLTINGITLNGFNVANRFSAYWSCFFVSLSRIKANAGLWIGVSIELELVVVDISFDIIECVDAENVKWRLVGTIWSLLSRSPNVSDATGIRLGGDFD